MDLTVIHHPLLYFGSRPFEHGERLTDTDAADRASGVQTHCIIVIEFRQEMHT